MYQNVVTVSDKAIAEFCQKHRIRKLSLFGSVLGEDFHSQSDIDVLVEFEPDTVVGWDIIAIQDELSELLGREVDLNTPGFLSRHFRQTVLNTAQVIYEREG